MTKKHMFLNKYVCPSCGYYWEDAWECTVLDECPKCGKKHVEPKESEDIIVEG